MSWHNASRNRPCPICHKTDWCTFSDDGAVCVCRRVESAYPAKSGIGWIHGLGNSEEGLVNREWKIHHSSLIAHPSSLSPDMSRIHARYDGDEVLLQGLALELGVDWEALKAMDVRFNHLKSCWSFPMRNAEGKITGLRYRELGGSGKWSERGSKDGLFYDPSLLQLPLPSPTDGKSLQRLVIVEGASDTAAALSLGLDVVGRSSCLTGGAIIAELIKARRIRQTIILADGDKPGINGAKRLKAQLKTPTRIVLPPPGVKDLRAWLLKGVTRSRLEAVASLA